MAKTNKTTSVEIKLTPEEKEELKAYCAERHITMSEFIRWAYLEKMQKGE